MLDIVLIHYVTFKFVHTLAVSVWLAGMIGLGYALTRQAPGDVWATKWRGIFKRGVILPSLLVAVIVGALMLAANPAVLSGQGWMHAKLTFVVLFMIFHGLMARATRRLGQGLPVPSPRVFGGITVFSLILGVLITVLALFRPF